MPDKTKEVTFEIEEHIGIISTNKAGWKKELNMVAWNNLPAKYDIRDWDEEHKTMSRGITFHKDEFQTLKELMDGLELAQ